jgi:hypothetical protein
MNALSRHDNKTYICSACGVREFWETEMIRKMPDLKKKLPAYCYYHNYLPRTPATVMLSFGVEGFYEIDESMRNIDYRVLNEKIGVTDEQAELMIKGSMWGWDQVETRKAETPADGIGRCS